MLEAPFAILVILILVTVSGFATNYKRRHRKFETAGTSILMTYYTEGMELIPLKKGLIGDMHFTAIAAFSKLINGADSRPALLFRVELPFHSRVHLLGIPKQSGAIQLEPAGGKSVMELVELEGDYPKYFSLFAEKEMQAQSRYVLDPKAMVFTIDFCQSHNWEILGGDLYFVQATANVPGDKTNMIDDAVQFVKEIEPAIAIPLTETEIRLRTPYNEERRTDLACPLCNKTLLNEQSFLACPDNHGFLLKATVLLQINRGTVVLPNVSAHENVKRNIPAACPACGEIMKHVPYNGGKTIIDSCNNCPYRWLDAGELVANMTN
ncbi:MAG: zf-TFIIB domain-containing protein [Patescibacteria group bacterium]